MDNIDIKDAILQKALKHVLFDGWSHDVMIRATADAGYDPAMARAVFPDGVRDLVTHFADWADREMISALELVDLDMMRVRDRVAMAVRARIKILEPHREAVRAALSFFALPSNAPRAAMVTWRTADQIWVMAGDNATDYNRYTKRGLLSGVLGATMLYWLSDTSDKSKDTSAFLDRRIDNVLMVGKFVGQAKNIKPGDITPERIGGLFNLVQSFVQFKKTAPY